MKGRTGKTLGSTLVLGIIAGLGTAVARAQEIPCTSPGRESEEDLAKLGVLFGPADGQSDRREISVQALSEFESEDGMEPLSPEARETVLADFASIAVHMTTRADLQARFGLDGGIHSPGLMRFFHPICRYCKIDVLFEFERDPASQCRAIFGGSDPVVEVSEPYLERPLRD